RRASAVACPLDSRDDDRAGAVGLQAVVEQAQRLAYPTGFEVLVERQGLLVHHRARVAVCVVAYRDGDRRELLARASELVEVAARQQCDLVDWPEQAEGPRPLLMTADALADLRPRAAGGRAPLAAPPCDRDPALAACHRHRRLADDPASRAAAVTDLAEERDVAEAEVSRDLELLGRLERVRRKPVDLGGRDAGVVEGGGDRF